MRYVIRFVDPTHVSRERLRFCRVRPNLPGISVFEKSGYSHRIVAAGYVNDLLIADLSSPSNTAFRSLLRSRTTPRNPAVAGWRNISIALKTPWTRKMSEIAWFRQLGFFLRLGAIKDWFRGENVAGSPPVPLRVAAHYKHKPLTEEIAAWRRN